MSHTNDTSNLFQTDAQHARSAYRAAKAELHQESGDPIKLASKPLRVVVRQQEGAEAEAWVAESGFVVQRVGLESGKTKQVYRGHLGPVTSLDFYTVPAKDGKPPRELMISGSWDKSFRVWDVKTKTSISTTVAHTDFIKTVLVLPSLKLLVTGSSDKDLRLWDLSSLDSFNFDSLSNSSSAADTAESTEPEPPRTGAAPPAAKPSAPLPIAHVLKSHIRPIERLASYAITSGSSGDDDEDTTPTGRIALLSADSLGALKTWEVWKDEEGNVKGELKSEARLHEIGIYDLVVGNGEIWTASADASVLLSTYSSCSPSTPPKPNLRIPHPSGMKSVLPLPLLLPTLNSTHLLTGASDEALRTFDLSSSALDLDDAAANYAITPTTAGPVKSAVAIAAAGGREAWNGLPLPPTTTMPGHVSTLDAHSHEVADLHAYLRFNEETGKKEAWVMSASVDGTLRRWKWEDVLHPKLAEKVLVPVEQEDEKSLLTAEEEAELEALMGDD